METIPYETFSSVEMRVGKVIEVQEFPEARKPAYKLTIDFGPEIGIKKSSAQITELYSKEDLLGRIVVCVVNFAPKQIGPFISECLTCGTADAQGRVVLLNFDHGDIPLGSKIY
jgi:tRNA-binding protein